MHYTQVDLVCFGELIWDMLPSGKVAGGAPFNIVNRATSLGLKSEVIGSLGKDQLGDEFIKLVGELGNSTSYIQRHDTLPTSVALVAVGDNGEPQYDIVHPVAWDDIQLDDSMISLVRSSRSFVFSSLALRDHRSREVLFQLLPHARLKICDINLRKGHFKTGTIMRMISEADVLRMNEDELMMIAQLLGIDHLDRKSQLKELAKKYDYQLVIATLGAQGALCYQDGNWFEQPVFKVNVKDTVGAGDAFLASFIYQYLKDRPIPECLGFACAVGAITASKSGGTPEISFEEIAEIRAQRSE